MNGKILREYRIEAVSNWSSFEDYIYREGTLLASVHPTEGTRWFGPDHLGTPRAVFNSSGSVIGLHTYYPFGEEATAATQDTQQMKFTGHERDLLNTPSGTADDTDYMHARQFSILTGRFHSFDPIGGNPRRPQSWNRYAYALGNPMKYTDPYGLDPAAAGPGGKEDPCGDDKPCPGGGDTITITDRPWIYPTIPGGGQRPGNDYGARGYSWRCGLFGTMCGNSDRGLRDSGYKLGELIPLSQRYGWAASLLGEDPYAVDGLQSPDMDPLEIGVTGLTALMSKAGILGLAEASANAFKPDQQALVALARAAQRSGGVTLEEARILRAWADEYKLLGSHGPEAHVGRGFGSQLHIHIGPVNHILVRPR